MEERIILLVEDNRDDEELTLRALKKHRITNKIIVARDGQEALDKLLGDKPISPEIVLLDISLPKINGIDVLKRIRADKRTALLPVIILTSSAEEADLLAAYNNHANSYILKPVDFDQFCDAVEKLGLYWLVMNQPAPKSSARRATD